MSSSLPELRPNAILHIFVRAYHTRRGAYRYHLRRASSLQQAPAPCQGFSLRTIAFFRTSIFVASAPLVAVFGNRAPPLRRHRGRHGAPLRPYAWGALTAILITTARTAQSIAYRTPTDPQMCHLGPGGVVSAAAAPGTPLITHDAPPRRPWTPGQRICLMAYRKDSPQPRKNTSREPHENTEGPRNARGRPSATSPVSPPVHKKAGRGRILFFGPRAAPEHSVVCRARNT